ncbi:MAG TPA: molybdenum cofactor biosynthesis protein MoaE [Methanocorpusculum sp.]|nr:molybdenum cofactor biosynthesis protein MoaE [Methanocorpusculum sp.]
MTDICRMQKEDIDIDAILSSTTNETDGAQIVFVGRVRDDGLEGLEIEADVSQAEKDLRTISDDAKKRFSVSAVHIIHRFGSLSVGEVIIVTVVCSSHRKEGYEASEYVIDKIKEFVPIWKQEVLAGGKKGDWVEVH